MPTTLAEFFIPTSYTRIIARELALQEKDLAQLLRGTGLSSDILLTAKDTYVSAVQQMQILKNALSISSTPAFGLQLGQQLQPSSHGPMGYLVLSSPDVLTALQAFADFLPVRLPFSSVRIAMDEEWLSCSLELKIDVATNVKRVLQECFALMIQSIIESILGKALTSARIELAHRKPSYHALYAEYLHSPTCFSQQSCTFILPAELATLANATSHCDAYALTRELCNSLVEHMPCDDLSLADRVKRQLLAAPLGSLTADDVASGLFVSKRTLQRRLNQEGSSYRDVTESLYATLAAQHLHETRHTVESIANLLGYGDTAAFRKAFHRWYGQSPGAYRQNLLV